MGIIHISITPYHLSDMKKEPKYLVELTATQMLELMEWHDSHVAKFRRMGIRPNYLKFHEESNLAIFIRGAYEIVKDRNPIFDVYDRRISQSEMSLGQSA